MFCAECGAELKEGQRFCTSCGAAAHSANSAPEPESTTPGVEQEGAAPRARMLWFVWVGIAFVAVAAIVGVVLLSQSHSNPPVTKAVVIRGNQRWTPTGLFLRQGTAITIQASGTVTMGAGWKPLPPSGNPAGCPSGGFPLPQGPCWSLIGRIGPQGAPFFVGSSAALRAPASGQLFLGVNDDALGDNSGQWTATVTASSVLSTQTQNPPAAPSSVKILSISPITSPRDTIVIKGVGFGSDPRVTSLGDGSVDTVAGPQSPWLSIIQNLRTSPNGTVISHGWAAGTVRGTDHNSIGVNLVDWTDTEILLHGFGKTLGPGQSWGLRPGDTLTFLVCGPKNHCGMNYAPSAATPQRGGAIDTVVVQPRASGLFPQPGGTDVRALVRSGQTSIKLPPGKFYVYGMATGGAAPSGTFGAAHHVQAVDAASFVSAALAYGTSSTANFTTQTGYYVIGGASISGPWTNVRGFYGSNTMPGASNASVSFSVPSNSLVVVIGLASSQQSVTLEGLPGLHVDASSSGPGASEGMVIEHAYLPPGNYTVREHSAALAEGQDPRHMADLIGVSVLESAN